MQFFPKIETLHLYTKEDKYLECGKIVKYVDWNDIGYRDKLKKQKDKNVEFKNISYTKKDIHLDYLVGCITNIFHDYYQHDLIIPEGVNKIEEYSLIEFIIKSIEIPESDRKSVV